RSGSASLGCLERLQMEGVDRLAAHAGLAVLLALDHRAVVLFPEGVSQPAVHVELRRRGFKHALRAVRSDPLAVVAPGDVQVRRVADPAFTGWVPDGVALLHALTLLHGAILAGEVQIAVRPAGALDAVADQVEDDKPVLAAGDHPVRYGARPVRRNIAAQPDLLSGDEVERGPGAARAPAAVRPAREVAALVVAKGGADLGLLQGRRDERSDRQAERVAKAAAVRIKA